MTRPGPKPVETEGLQVEATEWANVLFCLRDGQAGMIQKLKWGPWRSIPAPKPTQAMLDLLKGTPWEATAPLKTKRHRQQTGSTLVAQIVPANSRMAKLASAAVYKLGDDFQYWAPIVPAPRVWERLKAATSVLEMQSALSSLQKYLVRNWNAWPGKPFPRLLGRHAAAMLKAKRLFNYPKSRRGRSDDKRVVFFAKVLAGLELGRSPLYTMKRLGRWHPAKDLATNPYKEFVANVSRKGVSK